MSHMLGVRWRHRWRDITPGVGLVNFSRWEPVPYLSEYVCQIWLRSDGCVEKKGRTDRQTDKGTLQLYIVDNHVYLICLCYRDADDHVDMERFVILGLSQLIFIIAFLCAYCFVLFLLLRGFRSDTAHDASLESTLGNYCSVDIVMADRPNILLRI